MAAFVNWPLAEQVQLLAGAVAGFMGQARRDREAEAEVRRRREEASRDATKGDAGAATEMGTGAGAGADAGASNGTRTGPGAATATAAVTATATATASLKSAPGKHRSATTHSGLMSDDAVRIEEALDPVDPYVGDLLQTFAPFRRGWVGDEEYQVSREGERSGREEMG